MTKFNVLWAVCETIEAPDEESAIVILRDNLAIAGFNEYNRTPDLLGEDHRLAFPAEAPIFPSKRGIEDESGKGKGHNAMNVTIDMNEKDFERLTTNSMAWAGLDWQLQASRFEHLTEKYDTPLRWDWSKAYWVGGSWMNVIFARAFLAAQGEPCEIIYDTVDAGEYVILTNYTPCHRRFQLLPACHSAIQRTH